MMIRVLIALFSVKIYILLIILLPGRLLMSFEPVLRPDPLIQTFLDKKTGRVVMFVGAPRKIKKIKK